MHSNEYFQATAFLVANKTFLSGLYKIFIPNLDRIIL